MQQDNQNKIEIFKIIYDHYQNDFTLYWTRSNFFLFIQVGLLGYFSSNYISEKPDENEYRLLVSLSGLTLSIIWLLVILSSTKWINVWRKKVLEIDKEINPYQSFNKGENSTINKKKPFHEKFRPEYLSNLLSTLFITLWVFLIIKSIITK